VRRRRKNGIKKMFSFIFNALRHLCIEILTALLQESQSEIRYEREIKLFFYFTFLLTSSIISKIKSVLKHNNLASLPVGTT
jgi:hypothetical protein